MTADCRGFRRFRAYARSSKPTRTLLSHANPQGRESDTYRGEESPGCLATERASHAKLTAIAIAIGEPRYAAFAEVNSM